MRLIENKTNRYKDTQYKKYSVVIPNKIIKELNWENVKDLKCEVKNQKLIIEKK